MRRLLLVLLALCVVGQGMAIERVLSALHDPASEYGIAKPGVKMPTLRQAQVVPRLGTDSSQRGNFRGTIT